MFYFVNLGNKTIKMDIFEGDLIGFDIINVHNEIHCCRGIWITNTHIMKYGDYRNPESVEKTKIGKKYVKQIIPVYRNEQHK